MTTGIAVTTETVATTEAVATAAVIVGKAVATTGMAVVIDAREAVLVVMTIDLENLLDPEEVNL